jgi:hypothetical protein
MVVLGAEVAGGVVAGSAVMGGALVGGGLVVVGEGAVTGGCAGPALWPPLLEPQPDRPNATAVSAAMASRGLDTPAAGRRAPALRLVGFQHTRPAGGGVISPNFVTASPVR